MCTTIWITAQRHDRRRRRFVAAERAGHHQPERDGRQTTDSPKPIR